jgi:CBS domain containing-hemolysin-like protein
MIIILAIILFFIIYFEASEMSLVSSDEARLSNLALIQGGRYKKANEIRKKSDLFFSTVLVGINLMTVLFAMLLTREVGITWGLIISTLIIALIGEVLVKSLVIINPEPISALTAPSLLFFYWLFSPIIFFVKIVGDSILRLFKISGESREIVTKEEMNVAVKEARATGGINIEQFTVISSISKFSEKDVRDIMIPRVEIKAIDANCEIKEIKETIKNFTVSKMPVYKGTIDNIIGIIFKVDIIKRDKSWRIEDILRPIKFIHDDRRLEEILPELLSDKNGCAIVIDEYGGTEGFVSIDDILFDIIGKDLEMVNREDGTFIVDGSISPDIIGVETEEDTIAGLIISELQEIPGEGRKLNVGNIEMTILDATERKIKKVLIKRH